MTTTFTMILIAIMLWLAWPRVPKEPAPCVMVFDSPQDAHTRFAVGDLESMRIEYVGKNAVLCHITYRRPPEPPLKLKEEA